MKTFTKINGLYFAFVALFIIVSACNKDDDNNTPPTIKLSDEAGYISSDTVFAAGEEINFKVLMNKGDNELTNFLIQVSGDDGMQAYFDTAMNTASLTWTGSFIKTFSASEEWKFIVRDREGNSASTSITIGLDTSSVYDPLDYLPSVAMGAQSNNSVESCFDLTDDSYYFFDEATADTTIQAGIDLIYYFSEEDLNTIASPGANIEDGIFAVNPADWTVKNTTRYIKTGLTADDFTNAINDSILLANYNESDAKRKAKDLQADQVYTFRTQQGRLGMFLVNQVEGEAEGMINIHIKIQH